MPSRSSLAPLVLLSVVGILLLSNGLTAKALRKIVRVDNGEPEKVLSDAEALAAAKLKETDADALLSYFRQRTVSDADRTKIQSSIRKLGAEDFDERLKAADEVERYGPAAIGPLRAAFQNDPDPEISYRSFESLKRLEKVPHTSVAVAAVRALAKLQAAGTAEVLLAFLPLADDQVIADEIAKTLGKIAYKDGKADSALTAGLTDTVSLRRAAAAIALVQGNPSAENRTELFPKILKSAQTAADLDTKIRILLALVSVGHDKDAVGPMIDTLADLPRGRLWQAEDLLLQLAGKNAPKATFKKSRESVTQAQGIWKKWWDGARETTDLAKVKFEERITGKTVLILWDQQLGNIGTVSELGPDMKEKWKIGGLQMPGDVAFLSDTQVAIAEMNNNRISIREFSGRIVSNRMLWGNGRKVAGNQPISVQVMPNGNLLVGCRNAVLEFKKDKDELANGFARNQYDIQACHLLPNGETLLLVSGDPKFTVFLDAKLTETKKKLGVQMPHWQAQISSTGPDTVLIGEQQQLSEYNVKENKLVWKKQVNNVRSPQRLPNGNTLYVDQANRVVEVAPDGEEVWTFTAPANMMIHKVIRR